MLGTAGGVDITPDDTEHRIKMFNNFVELEQLWWVGMWLPNDELIGFISLQPREGPEHRVAEILFTD